MATCGHRLFFSKIYISSLLKLGCVFLPYDLRSSSEAKLIAPFGKMQLNFNP